MKRWLVNNQRNLVISVIIGIVLACFLGIILENVVTLDQIYVMPLVTELSKAILMLILLRNLTIKRGLLFGAITGISFGLFNYMLRLSTGCISPIFILLHIINGSISGALVAFVKKGEITFPLRLAVFILLMMVGPVMASTSLNQLFMLLEGTKATLCVDINSTTRAGTEIWNSVVEFFSLPK